MLRFKNFIGVALLLALCCGVAIGAEPTQSTPSSAKVIAPDTKVAGTFAGGPAQYWRLAELVHRWDAIELVLKNTGQTTLTVCALANVPDSKADTEVSRACDPRNNPRAYPFPIQPGGSVTDNLSYTRPTGKPLLRISSDIASPAGSYTLEVEPMRHGVSYSTPKTVSRISRHATLDAVLRYIDGTFVRTRRPTTLKWGRGGKANHVLDRGTVRGGKVRFRGELPASLVGKRITLAACVAETKRLKSSCFVWNNVKVTS